jgi:hypothetical protein
MAWLPDGSMLVTEKVEFYTTLKRLKTEVKNVPEVYIRSGWFTRYVAS